MCADVGVSLPASGSSRGRCRGSAADLGAAAAKPGADRAQITPDSGRRRFAGGVLGGKRRKPRRFSTKFDRSAGGCVVFSQRICWPNGTDRRFTRRRTGRKALACLGDAVRQGRTLPGGGEEGAVQLAAGCEAMGVAEGRVLDGDGARVPGPRVRGAAGAARGFESRGAVALLLEVRHGGSGDASTGEGSMEQHGRQPPGDALTGEASMASTTGQASEMVRGTATWGPLRPVASAACPVVGGWRAGGAVSVRQLGGPPVCAAERATVTSAVGPPTSATGRATCARVAIRWSGLRRRYGSVVARAAGADPPPAGSPHRGRAG